jgi:DNA-directed RNA polymerase subunit M/transcription elongation factor TFIIS
MPSCYKMTNDVDTVRARSVAMIDKIVEHPGLAEALERAILKHTEEFCLRREVPAFWDNAVFRSTYTHKVLSVRFNLRERPEVLAKVVDKKIGVKQFVDMRPWEIAPEKWEHAFDLMAKRELRNADANSVDPATMPDGILKCGKCGSMKTTYFQIQQRSADEPMSTYAQCVSCKARWKFC